jgi:hypothetical protein
MPFSVKTSSRWRKSEADRILTLANWNDATNFDTVYVHKIEGTYSISGTFKPGTRYKFIDLGGLALFIPIYFSIEGTITIPYKRGTSGYNVGISILGSMIYPPVDPLLLFSFDISLTRETGDISINICFSSKCNYILVTSGNARVDRYNQYIYANIASITDLTIHPSAYYSNPSLTPLDRINVNITGKLAAIAVTEYDKLSITEYSTPTPYGLPGMAMMSAPLAASAGVSSAVRGPPGWGNTLPSGSQKPPGAKP